MSVLSDLVAEYEQKVSCSNTPSLVIGNGSLRKNEIVIKIDSQGSGKCPQAIPLDPGEEKKGQMVAHDQTDSTCPTIVIQIGNQAVSLTQPNATENSGDSPPAPPPPPNVDKLQAQIRATSPIDEQVLDKENAPSSGGFTYFTLGAQVSVTVLTALLDQNSHSPSLNAKLLRDIAVGNNILGYVSSFNSILMCRRKNSLAARILSTIAYSAAAFGFIASMGMLLPDNINLWITLLACALCFPGLAGGLKG